jgi:hypothetical protein
LRHHGGFYGKKFEDFLKGNVDLKPSLEKCSTYGMGTIDYKHGSHI